MLINLYTVWYQLVNCLVSKISRYINLQWSKSTSKFHFNVLFALFVHFNVLFVKYIKNVHILCR